MQMERRMGDCGEDEVLIRDAISARTTFEGKGVALGSGDDGESIEHAV